MLVKHMYEQQQQHSKKRAATPKLLRAGSFQRWIAEQVAQDDAVRLIQAFVRSKLALSSTSCSDADLTKGKQLASVASCSSTVDSSAASSSDEADEEHEQLEVFLWHGVGPGLEFDSCPVTGFPRVVDDSCCNDSLPGMWNVRNGDLLISVNDCSTHCSIATVEQIVQIVEDGMRPAILRFRRPGTHEMEKAVMTRSRRMLSTARLEQQKRRERFERSLSYIIWREEDANLGIGLKPDKLKPYPIVSEVSPCGAVGRQAERSPVSVGDLLLSINHLDISQIGVKKAISMLQFAPRPLILTFRRTQQAPREARCLDL